MLSWSHQFNICAFLDNHAYQLPGHIYECILACGAYDILRASAGNALEQLSRFSRKYAGHWLLGHLSYDLKNEIEQGLHTAKPNLVGFDDLSFFVPEYLLRLSDNALYIHSVHGNECQVWEQIVNSAPLEGPVFETPVYLQEGITREAYVSVVEQILAHIHRGDCYELNYCMEFYATQVKMRPVLAYQQLTKLSPNPFAAYYRIHNSYLLCASPERFLQKKDHRLISQPIKGTRSRNLNDAVQDALLRRELQQHPKERSENVMVVDLVRNDLSRICRQGTVQVDELFGVYTFPQVHQMISTISGELDDDTDFENIIRSTFPMGSMTGAPKRKVMELIEKYEVMRRGIYAGAVGYIDPNGNFDFNVVIRSLMYNENTGYLSYMVGSGITGYCTPENEYEECLWKASAIRKLLEQ